MKVAAMHGPRLDVCVVREGSSEEILRRREVHACWCGAILIGHCRGARKAQSARGARHRHRGARGAARQLQLTRLEDAKVIPSDAAAAAVGLCAVLLVGQQLRGAASSAATSAPPASERRGTLRLGASVELPVYAPHDESRLPDQRRLLDLHDATVRAHLEWLGRKYSLRQDAL